MMSTISAREFLSRFVNSYGMTWEELFFGFTDTELSAKYMAELISDIEVNGQQTTVYVDKNGMVDDGNYIALSLAILNKDINYEVARAPHPVDGQLYSVEFDIDGGRKEFIDKDLFAILSFRVGDDWVHPIDADAEGDSLTVVMYCPGGENTATAMSQVISDRVERLARVSISSLRVSHCVAVDEDTTDW